jgi:hypothetical protein
MTRRLGSPARQDDLAVVLGEERLAVDGDGAGSTSAGCVGAAASGAGRG